jgi:hypothetical protein
MNRFFSLNLALLLATTALLGAADVQFAKSIIDDQFRSEGVNVGDINHDGKNDIVVGDVWYAAPDWTSHEIRKATRNPANRGGYSEAFAVYTDDFNSDGWVDVMVIPFHGKDAKWYENPKNEPGHWVERVAFKKTGNETRSYVDLFGTGERVFLMGIEGQIAWVPVPDNPNEPWPIHAISEQGDVDKDSKHPAFKYAHGLGFGDINGDGRNDVMYNGGWYEQPMEGMAHTARWAFHEGRILGDRCAEMYLWDGNLDGKPDVLATSAHGSGIYFIERRDEAGTIKFQSQKLENTIKECHALNYVDINGDGRKNMVTGRRFYCHGYNESKKYDPAELLWYELEAVKGGTPKLTPHLIDDQSGFGAQFVTEDFNGDGLIDIVTSGRKGVFLFIQYRGAAPKLAISKSLTGDSAVATAELLEKQQKEQEDYFADALYASPPITAQTPGHACEIHVDLKGSKTLSLRVSTEGDFSFDHADWVEPHLVGPDGTLKLTELKWTWASCGWQKVQLNKSVSGAEMSVDGKKVAYGIGTHAPSVINYTIPDGYTHFKAKGALDDSGTTRGADRAKVRFSVHK